ncbi:MAG TPA: TolC family protein, partial [Xanthomarina gelatinilytica]|nr:TolC family protein [Xanthomarina gelatinilytica]
MNRNIVTTVLLSIFISISGFAQDKKWGLEECVNYALENNISIKQTALDTDLADQDLISAKGNFLPNVNASASQDWNFGSFIGQDGNRVSIDSRGNSFGLNTGVTLFN